ncbi:MAG TPA: hypothetical protein VHK24_11295 [Steroidobacter sp.]|jgi:hypothetical protein|nr:hypothetical protein [Steroidobacter sp.]
MSLRVSFNLEDAELQRFEEAALQAQTLARRQSEEAVIAAARALLERGLQAQPAEFVKERYSRLRSIVEMALDPDWKLSSEDRQRVLNALACFSAPAAQGSTGGILDHAIMIELVSRDLHHDLQAYRDFRRFREGQSARHGAPGADRRQWLAQKRETLQGRMHKRRMRELEAAGSSVKRLFSLIRL